MLANPVTRSEGLVGADAAFQARLVSKDASGVVVTNEGKALLAADVSTIACTVYDTTSQNPGTPVATPAITSAAVSALVVDNNWGKVDAIGRNFIFQVPGTAFATAGHSYRVLFVITTTGGTTLKWYHEHETSSDTPVVSGG